MNYRAKAAISFKDEVWEYEMEKKAIFNDLISPNEAFYAVCHFIDTTYDMHFNRIRNIRNEFLNAFREIIFDDMGEWKCSIQTQEGVDFNVCIETCCMEA